MVEIVFASPNPSDAPVLALLEQEGGNRSELFGKVDGLTGGALTRAIEAGEFEFSHAKTLTLLAPSPEFSCVVLVGLGQGADLTEVRVMEAAGEAALALSKYESAALNIAALPEKFGIDAVTGAALALYRFDTYRTVSKDKSWKIGALRILTERADQIEAQWASASAVVRGVFMARDLASEPANILTPIAFAERAQALTKLGVEVEVLDLAAMQKLGFGALLGVAQGSANEPRTVIMRWNGGKEGEAPVAFAGKGVTFDSGGISIKPAAGMEDMKWDMAGAGAVTGLMAALAGRKAKANVVGIIGLVENMVSGTAQRPGDVVTSASGQTIEVLNTDAEGRLVLADILWYVRERFAPTAIVDLATLTGAIVVALGHERAGLFASDDKLAQNLSAAGEDSGEQLWRMPMGDAYDALLRSDIADMKNIGGRPAGSVSAAQFLKRFVGKTPWAHLDIAGTASLAKPHKGSQKGATGFGVRLLDRFVRDHYEA